jgi:hypothetical protein
MSSRDIDELDETPNKAPDEGCGFCSVLDDERPDECVGCPHSDDNCSECGGELVWADEIESGNNGALSDQGTGRMIRVCEECGKASGEARWVGV